MFKQVEQWQDGKWRIRKLSIAGWEYWEARTNYWWYSFREQATAFDTEEAARKAWGVQKRTRRWL